MNNSETIIPGSNQGKLKVSLLGKALFYLLVFLIPIQTRKVFLTGESFYYGFHSFYNTFYVYLTDIVLFGLIIAYLSENRKAFHLKEVFEHVKQDSIYLALGIFWLILAISVIVSRESGLSLWGLLKLSEFMLFFWYVRETVSHERMKVVFWIFIASMSFQALLGIIQYLGQGSLGLKLLGEEYLRPGMRDIAEFVSHGVANPWFYHFFPYLRPISDISVNLRAYGTFSHPNVFAGLLFMGLIANLYLLYATSPGLPASPAGGRPPSPGVGRGWGRGRILSCERIFLSLSFSLIFTGLVVTFSRFTMILSVVAVSVWFLMIFLKVRRPAVRAMHSGTLRNDEYRPANLAIILILIVIISSFCYSLFHVQVQDRFFGVRQAPHRTVAGQGKGESDVLESIGDRQLLANIALKMIKQKPLLGVGLRNFVVRMDDFSSERLMPYFHQPAHNIYLLVAAESGIGALVVFLILLFLILKASLQSHAPPDLRYTLLIIFLGFLAIGMVDHFPLTLQQGALAFWMTAGMLAAKPHTVWYGAKG